jgi:RNA polymerase sigma-70 factor (ECF subfamily)
MNKDNFCPAPSQTEDDRSNLMPKRRFQIFFRENFSCLVKFSYPSIGDMDVCESLVSEVFYRIWKKFSVLEERGNIKAYLYKSVYNEIMKYHRKRKVEGKYQAEIFESGSQKKSQVEQLLVDETIDEVARAIKKLPPKTGLVLSMSRFEGFTYREIADVLNISVKTVETHMGRAFKKLHMLLADYYKKMDKQGKNR